MHRLEPMRRGDRQGEEIFQTKDDGVLGIEPTTIEPGDAPLAMFTNWLSGPDGTRETGTSAGGCRSCCWRVGLTCSGWHAELTDYGAPTSNRIASSRGLSMLGPCGSVDDAQEGGVRGRAAAREGCMVMFTLHGESIGPGVVTTAISCATTNAASKGEWNTGRGDVALAGIRASSNIGSHRSSHNWTRDPTSVGSDTWPAPREAGLALVTVGAAVMSGCFRQPLAQCPASEGPRVVEHALAIWQSIPTRTWGAVTFRSNLTGLVGHVDLSLARPVHVTQLLAGLSRA
jgi:hypothetical protein